MLSHQEPVVVSVPELLWHGGGNENGKPDPVYSVDYHPYSLEGHGLGVGSVLCTSGIDASIPPKGSVRLWRIHPEQDTPDFLQDLSDHQSAVNVARFSPDGKMLASASNRQVVIYVVRDPSMWYHIADALPLDRIWLRPSLSEDIFDLQWSPDSSHVIIGAIDSKAEILRITSRDSVLLPGHCSYIQGVTWDPRNEMVATQSSDRSCKIHMIKAKPNTMVKVAPRGHIVMKMHGGYQTEGSLEDDKTRALTAADFGINLTTQDGSFEQKVGENGVPVVPPIVPTIPSVNLYADSFVPSFFRRLSFSPDGALLVTPTGIHRPTSAGTRKQASSTNGSTYSSSSNVNNKPSSNSQTYCTHIYSRGYLNSPYVSLVGLEDPSIVVRFYDRPYKLLRPTSSTGEDVIVSTPSSSFNVIPGDYRFVFAVSTISSVFVYDTQHVHPIAKFSGLHYAAINDLSWSEDGTVLTACSSDGYLSFFRFPLGTLGEKLDNDRVPELMKKARPCLFDYIPPCLDVMMNSEPSTTNIINASVKESTDKELTEGGRPTIASTDTDPHIAVTDEAPTIISINGKDVAPTVITDNGKDVAPTVITDNDKDVAPTIISINGKDVAPTMITDNATTIVPQDASMIIVGEASTTTTINDEDGAPTSINGDDVPNIINDVATTIILDDEASMTISRKAHINEVDAYVEVQASSMDVVVNNEPTVIMDDTTSSPDVIATAVNTMLPSISISTVEEKKRKRIQPTLIASLIGGSSIVTPIPSSVPSLVSSSSSSSSQETDGSMKITAVLNIDHTNKEMVHSQVVLSSPVPDENINSANRAHSILEEKEDNHSLNKEASGSNVALTTGTFPISKKVDGDECYSELTDSQRKRKRIAPTLIATYTGCSSSCALVATSSSSTTSKIIQQANQLV